MNRITRTAARLVCFVMLAGLPAPDAGAVEATGGTVTTSGDYTIHTFTSSGTFTVTTGGDVEYLVVGGGGGGGGGGGFRTGSLTVTPNTKHRMRNPGVFAENVYVASMDGQLRIYKVGDLMTTASGGSIGAPFNTVGIGKNPCSVDYGQGANFGDDLFITCRGDNAVYYLNYDGSTRGVLRDSRITDAVSACVSNVGRQFRGADWSSNFLHLMDFNGRKVLNYRYDGNAYIPVGDPPSPPADTIFEFSGEQSPPGYPFLFVRAEVI